MFENKKQIDYKQYDEKLSKGFVRVRNLFFVTVIFIAVLEYFNIDIFDNIKIKLIASIPFAIFILVLVYKKYSKSIPLMMFILLGLMCFIPVLLTGAGSLFLPLQKEKIENAYISHIRTAQNNKTGKTTYYFNFILSNKTEINNIQMYNNQQLQQNNCVRLKIKKNIFALQIKFYEKLNKKDIIDCFSN